MVIMIGLVAGAVLTYRSYQEVRRVPEPVTGAGEVLVYFDHPDLDVTLSASLSDYGGTDPYATTYYDLYIGVTPAVPGRTIRYFIVLTGGARPDDVYPDGSPLNKAGLCWSSVYFTTETGSYCQDLPPETSTKIPGQTGAPPRYLISGVITTNDSGYAFTTLIFRAGHASESSAGARSFFRFPSIGTRYLPPDARAEPYDVLGTGKSLYVANRLDLQVKGRSVSDTERIESATPDTVEGGQLTWVETDASTITARGTLVDVVQEAHVDRQLFLLGVLVSMLVTVSISFIRSLFTRAGYDPDSIGL